MATFILALAAVAAAGPIETTEADRTAIAVTIYYNDLALVRDERRFEFPEGEGVLQFSDVAERIRPETVVTHSGNGPENLAILEQNYEYDLISPERLMEKNIGRRVVLRNYHEDILFKEMEAELISVTGGPVYRVGRQIVLDHPGHVTFSDLPEDLAARPTLNWRVEAEGGEQTIAVSYLTGGMAWKADYVAHLHRDRDELNLQGWVTLTNASGATYRNAQLKLVAGEVNVEGPPAHRGLYHTNGRPVPPPPPEMQAESFAEYHLYALQRPTTINQNQTKQVQLLSGDAIRATRMYEFRGEPRFYLDRWDEPQSHGAHTYLKLDNREENGLGMPLPAGVIRLYQDDADGMAQYIAETRIDHTPRNEELRIPMGRAFDVAARRRQTTFRQVSDTVTEAAFEIEIRNHKDSAIEANILEPMPGDWEVLQASHPYEKKDARTSLFVVPVDANGATTVTYSTRVRR